LTGPNERGSSDPDRASTSDTSSEETRGQDPRDPAPRPGLRTFTIEGRAAPGLFVVGWIATILGTALTVAGLTAGGGGQAVLLVLGLLSLSVGLVAGAGSQAFERRARGAPYAGPSPVLVFAAAIPATLIALTLVGLVLRAIGFTPSDPVRSLFSVIVQTGVYLGLLRLLVVGTGALSWREMGFIGSSGAAIRAAAWGAAFAGVVVVITLVVTAALVSILQERPESPLPPAGDPTGLLVNLVTAAVFAPIGEEIFFRGFATTVWERSLGARRAIIQGGLMFAFAHVVGTTGTDFDQALAVAIVAFGARIPIALFLGWLLIRRRTIWAPIGLHAAFNAFIILLVEFGPTG
jgi:membrane protease YdiL (CAAX protease family)